LPVSVPGFEIIYLIFDKIGTINKLILKSSLIFGENMLQ